MTNSTATQPSAQVAELLRALPAFRITREWLKQHGTKGCGWNQTQIRALGIDWPPREGWTREIVGNSISVAQKRAFETAAKSPAAVSARNPGLHCTLSLLGTHTKLMSMHARDGAPAGDFLEWLSGVLPRLDATATTERSLKAIAEIAARFASDVEAHCKA